MAVSAHTHFSTGYRSVLGYQSSITPFPAENQVLLNFDDASRGQVLFALGSSNALQRAEMGWGTDESQDPKGCVLRKLRLERNLDPAVLATRACVSVKQLFALEKGLDQPFPSDTLRRQAGRKVARILGMDWDSALSASDEAHAIAKGAFKNPRNRARPPRKGDEVSR